MHGLALIGMYVVVALAGQVIGFGVSSLAERAVPWAGMPMFLAVFFGMLVLAWPIAVLLTSWLLPESTETPVRSRVA